MAMRLALATYYEYRISRVESQVEELQKQRETTIEKLKTATKYNSTQQLLEKYGASPPQPRTPPSGPSRRKSGATPGSNSTPRGGRTGVPPPPTANIQRSPLSLPGTPQEKPLPRIPQNTGTPSPIIRRLPDALQPGEPEFAPNAFPAPPQYSAFRSGTEEPKWYDRIMDVLLGEDETLPKNRLALLCEHCKLVNGQAPPGVKRVADIGKWRCGGCGAWNGEEKDAKKLVAEIREQAEEIAGVGAVEDPDARIPRRSSFLEKSEPEDEDTIVLDVPHPEGVGETPSDIAATEKTSASSASEDESEGEPEPVPAPKPKRGRPKGGSNKRS
ncbi:MAG: hypothetical protein M1819_001719 [Sarea resinae]|nr:MAG: hypothetical protein M1819_001719 [Sarea resinae]